MKKVSKVLGDHRADLVTLMRDGDKLFRALADRRDAVHNLLVSTSQLSVQLTGMVKDTRADLKPALDHLYNVVQVLQKNQDNLDNSLRLMAPFYRVFANTLGTGPWFDTYIQNLPPVPALGGQ
jgi:phospholipid/cholesterol/gamma-HCH transport system substrate-binding protein